MFAILTIATITFAEFEFTPFEEVVEEFFESDLLAKQDNQTDLGSFLKLFDRKNYRIEETENARFYVQQSEEIVSSETMELLFERYVKEGSTVVDYGADRGVNAFFLSNQVGFMGKVVAFESRLEAFREMYWNLTLNGVTNTKIYCTRLGNKKNTLDSFELENVSFIKINANGAEDLFLKGAEETIKRCRPVIVVKILGGISVDRSDRYVREAYNARIEQIQKLGYSIQQIAGGECLALP